VRRQQGGIVSDNLKKFLVDLASDPERLRRYAADPAGELDGAGLSDDEKAAVLSRDARSLRRSLKASPVDHMTIISNGAKAKTKAPKKPGGKKKTKAGKKK
jgi:hypothetical protein